ASIPPELPPEVIAAEAELIDATPSTAPATDAVEGGQEEEAESVGSELSFIDVGEGTTAAPAAAANAEADVEPEPEPVQAAQRPPRRPPRRTWRPMRRRLPHRRAAPSMPCSAIDRRAQRRTLQPPRCRRHSADPHLTRRRSRGIRPGRLPASCRSTACSATAAPAAP